MSRGSPNPQAQAQMDTGSLTRPGVVDPEKFFQKYEAMKEDYDSLRKRYADLIASHSGTVNKLELAQEEVNRVKKLYEDALQETSNAIRERNGLKQQCTAAIRQWDSALRERNEYKEALGKVQQQHEEAMKEINQAMASRIKSNKDIKRLTEERDAVSQEISLIMSERDSVHRELEKLTDDLAQSKKQIKALETQNKELTDKVQEAVQEAEVSKKRRDWAFVERDKIVRERESLRTLCDRLRRERDRAVTDLAEALSESEDIKKQKNLASKQLKELRERFEMEKENRSIRFQYLSNSSSFSESRDSAIDSDMPSGHYSIKLPNVRGADHGLVLEPGVYISRIVPGSPASKEMNLNIGDRVLFINDTPIDNVQDAILALSEDIDPIMLTLSRSAGQLSSPINSNQNSKNQSNQVNSKSSAHASTSSLKSDKSDPHNNVISRRHVGGGKTGIRDIFRVRLPRKKLSSPEEAILATLNSAIDSGAGTTNNASSTNNSAIHNSRKNRKKRTSSRNSGGESSVNKNGTWPRVVINKNSACSYTLPQDVSIGTGVSPRGISDNPSVGINHHNPGESVFYGQYIPINSSTSNTVCIRRPGSGKDRTPISNLWDYPAKSVGAIAIGGGGGNTSLGGNNMSINSKSLTLAAGGRSVGGGIALDNHGLPAAPNTGNPHHRYSFGVFDPSPSNKIGKGAPERNSVVPTLTMSDGSSIDFSVKSGNMEILEYYVKRMVKNQNNSSESDHLDKVVTPPSLAIPNIPVGSGSNSNVLGQSALTSTLDRFPNRQVYPPRYSIHNHDVPGSMPVSSSTGGPMHMSMPKSNNSFAFEPTFHHTHSHGGSNETPSTSLSLSSSASNKTNLFRNSDDLLLHPPSYPIPVEPSGTFPRKSREVQRIRIPSNQSVTSRSSTEKFDLRNSPMPTYHIEVLDPGAGSHSGASDFGTWPRKPASGELRKVRIDKYDKSTEPLGIQISCKANGGGVFVSSVNEHSLASQVGLQIGDQLLEVCGINMRTATYNLAANVLRQCGDSITMLVQYSPEKYREDYDDGSSSDDSQSHSDGESSSSPDQDENNSSLSENESRSGSRSGSPTPCNSPQSTLVRNSKKNSSMQNHSQNSGSNTNSLTTTKSSQTPTAKGKDQRTSGGDRGGNSIQNSSASSSLTKSVQQQSGSGPGGGVMGVGQQVQSQSQQQQILQAFSIVAGKSADNPPSEQSTLRSNRSTGGGGDVTDGKMLLQEKTRFLTLQLMKNSSNLGVCLVGGNVVGIFVHSVQKESIADRSGLRTGDQILEYNGTDLRHATAEEAAFELAKPLDKVGVLVLYNLKRYNEIKDQPGDGFYIRALFDYPSVSNDHHHQHQGTSADPQQLSFLKDEILYVDNTMYNGKPGRWRAWKVDSEGHRRAWGVIPSKFKVEEDLMFKRGLGDLDSDRRTSTVTRRSFFRRKSHHRSSSRELASFSDFSINSYGDLSAQLGGLQLKDDAVLAMNSYQRVERLDYMCFLRPVLILGALSDLVSERLCQDFPYQFGRVALEVMHCSGPMLEKGLAENIFVDYKRKGSHYECVTMAAIKETSAKKLYCILDVSTAGVERLQRAQMYPIVLIVKFKSAKQIREVKDLRCDKITQKAAKELYEHSLKVESEYKHLITACVPGGTNISYLATQVKTYVEKEQSKTLWVPI